MKIIAFSDFHLGFKQYKLAEREKDFFSVYHQAIDKIIDEKPDLVINTGDVFDVTKPSPEAINEYRKGLKKLKENNIPTVAIVGNHTTLSRNSFYPIDYLFIEDYDLTILDKENPYITKNDIFIGGVPYHSKHKMDELIDKTKELANAASDYDKKILLLHQAFETDLYMAGELNEEDLPLDDFDLIIVGHIHKRIHRWNKNTQILYPGSIERSSITEAKYPHGYSVIDTKSFDVTHVDLDMPRKIFYAKVTQDKLQQVLNDFCKKEYNDPPILSVDIVGSSLDEIKEIISLTDIYNHTLRFRYRFFSEEEDNVEEKVIDKNYTIEDLIKQSLDDDNSSNLAIDLYRTFNSNDDNKDQLQKANDIVKSFAEKNFKEIETFI